MTDDTSYSEDSGYGRLVSIESETNLLGCALLYPAEVVNKTGVRAEHFFLHRNRYIWEAIVSLLENKITPDFVSVTDKLESMGKIGEIGGSAYLAALISGSYGIQYDNAANIILELAARRNLVQVASDLAKGAYDRSVSVGDTVITTRDRLSKAPASTVLAQPYASFTSQVYDEVAERSKNPTQVWGMPTGLIDFDKFTGGIHKYEVFYLAGEPGIGKTKLMHQIALALSGAGHCGAVFSLEMRGTALARRGLSLSARIPTRHLKTGKLEGDEWNRLTQAVESSEKLPLWICDMPLSLGEFCSQVTRMVYEYGIEWFALDYLLLLGGFDRLEETERSAHLSRGVKNLVHGLPVAGITVNSVTKDAMDGGAPGNKSVRGSGQVIHDADTIAFLTKHQPDKGQSSNPNLATLTFTKGRELDGGVQSIDLFVRRDYPAFADAVKRMPGEGSNLWYQKD